MTELEWPFEGHSDVTDHTVVRKDGRRSMISSDMYPSWPVIVNGFLEMRKVKRLLKEAGLLNLFPSYTTYHEHCHPFLESGFDMLCAKKVEQKNLPERLEACDEVVSLDVQDGSMRFQPTPVEVGGVIEMEVTVSAEDSR